LGERQIVLGRELTKLHETILRGSADELLLQLQEPKGEFVVAEQALNLVI
jgi:16S rRNA C1402 (ribose-2'-O) methylase RsmI